MFSGPRLPPTISFTLKYYLSSYLCPSFQLQFFIVVYIDESKPKYHMKLRSSVITVEVNLMPWSFNVLDLDTYLELS